MDFKTPDFTEIKMDAEISSYQEADEPTRDPQFCKRAVESTSASPQEADAPRA